MKKLFSILISFVLTLNTTVLPVTVAAEEASGSAVEPQTEAVTEPTATPPAAVEPADTDENAASPAANPEVTEINATANSASADASPAATTPSPTPELTATGAGTVPAVSVTPMPYTTWTGEGDWATRNQQTGSNSSNSAATVTKTDATVNNTNAADVTNNTSGATITGNNKASDNTGNGAITTGTASFAYDGKNIVNLNATAVWKGDGDWSNGYDGSVSNGQTGSNSTNNASNSATNSAAVTNTNDLNLVNNLEAAAISGNNVASDNTGNGGITSGDANLVASLLNLANTNVVGTDKIGLLFKDIYGTSAENVDLGKAAYFNTADLGNTLFGFSSNDQTGSNSANNADNNLSNVYSIDNKNNGQIVNNLDLSAVSGDNKASDNTGNGNIETGDASVIANLVNFLNTNVVTSNFLFGMVNVFGGWNGNLVLPQYSPDGTINTLASLNAANSKTGSNSENAAQSVQSNAAAVTNTNVTDVKNNVNLNAASGDNSSNANTLGGTVTSGDTNIKAGANTIANQSIMTDKPWWLVLVNKAGTVVPQLVGPDGSVTLFDQFSNNETLNNQTGSGSDNKASDTTSNSSTLTNQNNGSITNNITGLAKSGGNASSDNTGTGSVTSGDSSLLVSALNFINTNLVTPNLMISLVNVFGDWTGKIVSHDNAGSSNPITETTSPSTVDIQANPTVNTTGPDLGINTVSVAGGAEKIKTQSNKDNEPKNDSNRNEALVLGYFDKKDTNVVVTGGDSNYFPGIKETTRYSNAVENPANPLQAIMSNQLVTTITILLAIALVARRLVVIKFILPYIKRGLMNGKAV